MTAATQRLAAHRLDALDGLRGLAVALVFLVHVRPTAFPGGYEGVMLFFTLSGFLITSLLLQEWRNNERIALRAFYLRRCLRLMPALVAMVVATVAANVVLGTVSLTTVKDASAALFYVMDIYAPATHTLGGGYNHTWSLAVEEQFYLIWPAILVVALARRWSLVRIVVGWMVGLTVLTAALAMTGAVDADGMYRIPTTHFPEIGAGILLAVLLTDDTRGRLTAALRHRLVAAAGIAVLLVLLFTTPHRSTWLYLGGFTLGGLAFAGLVGATVVSPGARLSRWLSLRPLLWLGRRSYGFYLWHAPVLEVLHQRVHGWWMVTLAGLAISLLVTELSWRIVELPFLRLKRRFERVTPGHDELEQPPVEAPNYQVMVASS